MMAWIPGWLVFPTASAVKLIRSTNVPLSIHSRPVCQPSTVGGFIGNYEQFHRADGAGYDFVADVIIKMDSINPVTAGRYVEALGRWGSYSEDHQKLMIAALEKIAAKPDLSTPVADKVFKSLPKDDVRQQLGLPPAPKI